VSIREFFAIVRRRWIAIGILAVIAVGLAGLTAPAPEEVRKFRATATVAVLTSRTATSAIALEPVSADIAAVMVTLGDVPARVATRLGYEGSPGNLANQVSVRTDTTTQTLDLSVTHADGEGAASVANAFAHELVTVLEEKRQAQVKIAMEAAEQEAATYLNRLANLDSRITPTTPRTDPLVSERDVVARQYSQATVRLDALGASLGPQASRATVIQEAVPRPAPSQGLSPPVARMARLAAGGLVGLLVGLALAMVIEKADPHVLTKRQAELAFGDPVLVEVPYVPRSKRRDDTILTVAEPQSAVAEAYRNLRTALLFMPTRDAPGASGAAPASADAPDPLGRAPGIVLVASPGPSEGKTTCVANLAASLAELGKSVLVVSGDVRKPTLHTYFGVPNTPGLTDVARNGLGPEGIRKVVRKTAIDNVFLVPSGKAVDNPAALMASLRGTFAACRALTDVVLIDTPPLLLANDARELLAIADAVVVVGRAGRTTISGATEAGEVLHRLNAPVVGVVFIGDASGSGYGRYGRYGKYGKYGGYYSSNGANGHRKRGKRASGPPLTPTRTAPLLPGDGDPKWDPGRLQGPGPTPGS
jgi:capsular exopolysaccharide synthesis family protein